MRPAPFRPASVSASQSRCWLACLSGVRDMRQNNALGRTKLPNNVGLIQCANTGIGRTQIAEHYGVSVKQVTARFTRLRVKVPMTGKTYREARFNFGTVVVRRHASSITLPCPKIYAMALEYPHG